MAARFKSPDLTSALLPIMVTERGVLAMLVTSQLLAALLAFAPMSVGSAWERLGLISLFIHLVSTTSLAVVYGLKTQLSKLSSYSEILIILAIFQTNTLILSLLSQHYIADQIDWTIATQHCLLGLGMQLFFIYLMSIYAERVETIKTLSKVELDALHARIRPHFLNNSLNAIAELTHVDPQAAEQATLNLARLSQAAIRTQQLTTLEDEINLSKQYLAIEAWRFGDKFEVVWQVDSCNLISQLPVLTMQPLLENAVNYGIEPSGNRSQIDVLIIDADEQIAIKITNPITHHDCNGHSGQGIALSNIKARIELHFGNRASLQTTIEQDKFVAELRIPIGAKV
ncbi:alginate biosynthesis protein [Pseudoalteromonas phenolica]|uniref:Alginate biosynthesis protein n=1 Tax=Pseudoalteromonas phenolica TaxID=161398 RepID=A0A4Q7IL83_9GAMM|nr:histidine kinase [Pseudoalteromonas phenolica]RZQ52036.1 alginate biosynthesis protein [Pseudoalteromonas phenolica]